MAEYIGKLMSTIYQASDSEHYSCWWPKRGGGGGGWVGRKAVFSLPTAPPRKKKRILVSFMYVPTNPGRADVSFEDN